MGALTPTTRAVMRSGIVLSLLSLSFLASLLQSVNGEELNDQKFDEMIVQISNIAKSFNKFVDNYTDSYREKMSNIREAEAAANERRRRRRRRGVKNLRLYNSPSFFVLLCSLRISNFLCLAWIFIFLKRFLLLRLHTHTSLLNLKPIFLKLIIM